MPVKSLIKEVQKWEATQHGYHFDKEDLVFIEGVVPAISTAIQAFTKEGEAVLINTPVYPPFARSVKLNNRRLITNSLVEKDGLFEIDFDRLEKEFGRRGCQTLYSLQPSQPWWTCLGKRSVGEDWPTLPKTRCFLGFR